MSLTEAVERSLAAAEPEDRDEAAFEACRLLARKIDAWDQIVEWALEDVEGTKVRPKVPANDNVSIPALLKYLDALHLTPASRVKLPKGEEKPVDLVDDLKARRDKRKPA